MSAGKVVAGGAVGVALGTLLGFFVLAPNIDGGPDRVVGDSRDELAAATSERDTASAENDAADGIIAAAAPDLVRDALKDRPVLVISTADADAVTVEATRTVLDAAGAVNAGDLRLTEAFTDQDKGDELKTIAASSLPAKAKLSEDRRDPGYHAGELLGQALVDTLKAHGATFCLGLHGKMPPIEDQLPMLRALWPGPLVCRWNLNRIFGAYGYADAQKKHDPFNAILSEDLPTRTVLARTIRGITGAGQPAYVTISNDAEGCAPLSIQMLAQAIAA
jgi:hypothetical protein